MRPIREETLAIATTVTGNPGDVAIFWGLASPFDEAALAEAWAVAALLREAFVVHRGAPPW